MARLKILLVNPPIKPKNPPYNIPLGLACIAGMIDAKGHDVALFDNNAFRITISDLITQIKDISWDMICIGNLITTYRWQKDLFKELRHEYPNTILQAGGGLATSLQKNLMNWVPEIDIIVVGEGERTICQVLDNFNEKNWECVNGIIYRKNNEIIRNKPQLLLSEEELSQLPLPKYDLLPLEEVYFKYSGIPLCPESIVSKRRLSIEASRGCPFTCSFCIDLPSGNPRNKQYSDIHEKDQNNIPLKRIRYYDPEYVVKLIKYLRLKYAIDFINFTDDCFTSHKNKVIQFCTLMEKEGLNDLDPPLYFSTTAHVNTINPDILNRLKNAGCRALDLGIESMNQNLLKNDICKKSTPQRNRQAVNECLKVGMYPITNLLIGLPEESLQSVYDNTKFLIDYNIECGPFFVTPYPMTGLFERFKKTIVDHYGTYENYVLACEQDVSQDFVINLTKYNGAELLGLRQMLINHDIVELKQFAQQKGETIIERID